MRMTYSERKERRRQKEKTLREERERHKNENTMVAKKLIADLRDRLKNCGLTPKQIAQCAGLEFSTVDKLFRGYNKALNVNTFVALWEAAGFDLKPTPKKPGKDRFRIQRRVPLPKVEE